MAVSYQSIVTQTDDATSSSTLPSNIDLSSGSDQLLVAAVAGSDDAAQNPTGVTWDVATPENLSVGVQQTAASFYNTDLWYLASPTQASDTITVTFASDVDDFAFAAIEFEGVDGSTSIGNTGNTTSTSGTTSITLTSVNSGDMCVDVVLQDRSGSGPFTITPGSDQTERAEVTTSGLYNIGMAVSTQAGSDGGEMLHTTSPTSAQVLQSAMVLKEASGGGGGSTTIYNTVSSGGVVGAGNSFIVGSGGAVG